MVAGGASPIRASRGRPRGWRWPRRRFGGSPHVAPGFTLALVVVGEVVRRAARRARVTADPVERVLLLALAADLLTRCLLQNYFNSVYHATVMVMLVGMLAAAEEERPADVTVRERPSATARSA